MGKADKATALRRTQEVTRLVLAGAEFPEIRQYASDHGWDLSERQIRRYQKRAYQQLAKSARRDREELLGRHLMQRRALYARAMKAGDIRTALTVLKDEAELEGLYPSANGGGSGKGGSGEPEFTSALSREERTVRFVNATAQNDRKELALLQSATPRFRYLFPDTMIPSLLLHVLALQYVNEQLEYAGLFLLGVWQASSESGDDRFDELWLATNAYMYRVGHDGWRLFLDKCGLEGSAVVGGNYDGQLLELADQNLLHLAPAAETLRDLIRDATGEENEPVTAEDKARQWRRQFRAACREPGYRS